MPLWGGKGLNSTRMLHLMKMMLMLKLLTMMLHWLSTLGRASDFLLLSRSMKIYSEMRMMRLCLVYLCLRLLILKLLRMSLRPMMRPRKTKMLKLSLAVPSLVIKFWQCKSCHGEKGFRSCGRVQIHKVSPC